MPMGSAVGREGESALGSRHRQAQSPFVISFGIGGRHVSTIGSVSPLGSERPPRGWLRARPTTESWPGRFQGPWGRASALECRLYSDAVSRPRVVRDSPAFSARGFRQGRTGSVSTSWVCDSWVTIRAGRKSPHHMAAPVVETRGRSRARRRLWDDVQRCKLLTPTVCGGSPEGASRGRIGERPA